MIVVIQTKKLDSNFCLLIQNVLRHLVKRRETERDREKERKRDFFNHSFQSHSHTHSHSECHHLKQSLVIKAGQLFCCCCCCCSVFSVWSAVVSWCCAGLVVDALLHLFQVLMKVVMMMMMMIMVGKQQNLQPNWRLGHLTLSLYLPLSFPLVSFSQALLIHSVCCFRSFIQVDSLFSNLCKAAFGSLFGCSKCTAAAAAEQRWERNDCKTAKWEVDQRAAEKMKKERERAEEEGTGNRIGVCRRESVCRSVGRSVCLFVYVRVLRCMRWLLRGLLLLRELPSAGWAGAAAQRGEKEEKKTERRRKREGKGDV